VSKRLVVSASAMFALLTFAHILWAQTDQPPGVAEQLKQRKWNNSPPVKTEYDARKKARPAPRRDLWGLWDGTAEGGIQANGPIAYPANPGGSASKAGERPADDPLLGEPGHFGQPDERGIPHHPPYTALGEEALRANKPGTGIRAVPPGELNDPVDICDPQGFPRMELYELRVVELAHTKNQVLFLNQFYDNWRVIWTDGRELPKDPEPRWNGYSVGKWVDDYTFVVDTVGMDERTWLDNVGRPHSSDLHVQEVFHRADYDTLELSVKIEDPKMYAQSWMALNKYVLHRLPDNFDVEEFFCSPSETAAYNKVIGKPVTAPPPK